MPAQPFEQPPTFRIEKIPGFWPSGDNYTIKNPVRSDGLLRIYTLATPYGEFAVHGDQMLRMRLNELAALHELEKIAGSESYGKALVDAGLSPFKYTGRLITDPKKTVGDTFSGIGTMFGRISADLSNIGKTPGDPISGLLGVTDQRRKLATKVGVDPYTDFPPLDAKLSQLVAGRRRRRADGAGRDAGGAGHRGRASSIPISAPQATSERVQIDELARDRTASQIFDLNREQLHAMGADDRSDRGAARQPQLHADRHGGAGGGAGQHAGRRGPHGVPAAGRRRSTARSLAYFMRRHAEMLKNQQARGAGFVRFVSLGGYPFNVTRDGRLVGAMPIDSLSWTETIAAVWRECAADARRVSATGRVELRITGTATPLASKELQALGWRVVENTRF